jgi:hypothetical protein
MATCYIFFTTITKLLKALLMCGENIKLSRHIAWPVFLLALQVEKDGNAIERNKGRR